MLLYAIIVLSSILCYYSLIDEGDQQPPQRQSQPRGAHRTADAGYVWNVCLKLTLRFTLISKRSANQNEHLSYLGKASSYLGCLLSN